MKETNKQVLPGFMVYFDEFRAVLDELSDSEKGRLFEALFRYFESGEEPEKFQDRFLQAEFNRLKTSITKSNQAYLELQNKRKEGGKKRWKQDEAAAEECSGKQSSAEETSGEQSSASFTNTNTNTNTNTKTNTKTKTKERGDAPPPRSAYGEYGNVLLSDSELEKLKSDFPRDWAALIEELSTAMQSKGMHYKDHLATMRNWALKDGIKRQGGPVLPAAEKPKPKPVKGRSPDDIMRDPDHPGQWILKPEVAAREAAAAGESSGGELT